MQWPMTVQLLVDTAINNNVPHGMIPIYKCAALQHLKSKNFTSLGTPLGDLPLLISKTSPGIKRCSGAPRTSALWRSWPRPRGFATRGTSTKPRVCREKCREENVKHQ